MFLNNMMIAIADFWTIANTNYILKGAIYKLKADFLGNISF